MRLATYNINGVLNRLAPLKAWLDVTQPDVVCLQEIKCTQAAFPFDELRAMGYEALVHGQRAWNGVAILARGAKPMEVRRGLPDEVDARQARYLEAAVGGILVACLYAPNGNPQPGPKFDYKLAWSESLHRHAASLVKTGHPVVLAGDFNVVPTDAVADIYSTRSFKDNALLQPGPRAAYRKLLALGWSDALREQFPTEAAYTFWSYLRNRWPRDAGLRIDHILLSPSLRSAQAGAGVDKAVRGIEGASDHAPVWVEIGL